MRTLTKFTAEHNGLPLYVDVHEIKSLVPQMNGGTFIQCYNDENGCCVAESSVYIEHELKRAGRVL